MRKAPNGDWDKVVSPPCAVAIVSGGIRCCLCEMKGGESTQHGKIISLLFPPHLLLTAGSGEWGRPEG